MFNSPSAKRGVHMRKQGGRGRAGHYAHATTGIVATSSNAVPLGVVDRRFMKAGPSPSTASLGAAGRSPGMAPAGNKNTSKAWMMTGVCELNPSGRPTKTLGGVEIECGKRKADAEMEDDDRMMIKHTSLYGCESCSKTFREREHYIAHLKTHVLCAYDGCDFEAIPTLLSKHVAKVHERKSVPEILPGVDPSMQNWISERRRNFPTSENAAFKKQVELEKIARGEVALLGAGMTGVKRVTETDAFKKMKKEQIEKSDTDAMMANRYNNDLMVDFEEDDKAASDTPEKIRELLTQSKQQSNHFLQNQQRKRRRFNQNGTSTLLEKLLQPEIRRERNHVLQCIRYIVQHQYFLSPDQLLPGELEVKKEPKTDPNIEQVEIDSDEEEEGELTESVNPAKMTSFSVADMLKSLAPENEAHSSSSTDATSANPGSSSSTGASLFARLLAMQANDADFDDAGVDEGRLYWGTADVDNEKYFRKSVDELEDAERSSEDAGDPDRPTTPGTPQFKAPEDPVPRDATSPGGQAVEEAQRLLQEIEAEFGL